MIDGVDAALIRELRADGRTSFQLLGQRVGLSRTAVRSRVRRLLASGALRIGGIVNAEVLGMAALAVIWIDVEGPVGRLAGGIARRGQVFLLTCVSGAHPVLAALRARDDGALSAELDEIRGLPGVRSIEVFRCVRVGGSGVRPTGPHTGYVLDSIDWRLLRELQRDGRASYARLARLVGLSQAAARARVIRMLDTGVVRVTSFYDPRLLGVHERIGVGLRVRGGTGAATEKLVALDGVDSVLAGYGRYDVVAELGAADRERLHERLEMVRALPEVRHAESWQRLAMIKSSADAGLGSS